ncbi:hypothetical protein Maq22A_c27765 [Methylobacterium aquaticum]|uniref:Uncharacterized protein n=1 Tax=Methylobacterium aquaticum TaxID=270351 RepID=A0A1Y0Z8J0_9HYPH|nr:hypothetical protein Maq22A_c27765 [Methylobacterium aquaticum]
MLLEALVLAVRRLLGEDDHDGERDQHERAGEAVDRLPAIGLGERRREQHGEHGARVAGPGDAHRQALVLRREPARAEGQGDAEGRARDAEQHAHGEHVGERVHQEEAVGHRQDDQRHLGDRGVLAPDILGEHAEGKAHDRAGQDRQRDHEPGLGRRELVVLGDERTHGAVEHPDRETEIEVQECGEQGRGMARLHHGLETGHLTSLTHGPRGGSSTRFRARIVQDRRGPFTLLRLSDIPVQGSGVVAPRAVRPACGGRLQLSCQCSKAGSSGIAPDRGPACLPVGQAGTGVRGSSRRPEPPIRNPVDRSAMRISASLKRRAGW